MRMDPLETKIAGLIEDSITDMGYELVRVSVFSGNNRKTLQIMIDKLDGNDIVISDCEKVHYYVSAVLEVDDIIPDAYNLEISSPGIDRPLIKLKDFVNNVGFNVKLSTIMPIDGRKNYKGKLVEVEGDKISILMDGLPEVSVIEYENIANAKLVLDDILLNAKSKK